IAAELLLRAIRAPQPPTSKLLAPVASKRLHEAPLLISDELEASPTVVDDPRHRFSDLHHGQLVTMTFFVDTHIREHPPYFLKLTHPFDCSLNPKNCLP